MGKMKIKTSPSRKAFLVFDSLLMILLALVCIYPFWYVLCYSFSDTTAASVNPPVILPSGFTLSNYKEILTLKGFFPALGMSVLRTVVGTGLSVFCCSFLAYLFTKDKMPARKILYRFVVFTMYISGGMIATYIVIKSYGLLNNFWVYILPTMISAYNMILIKTYIEQLPPALEESAALDGAGYITCFFKIILPLCKPIIATVVVFVAVGQWNSWFDNHIYTRANESLTTLQYLLYNYLNEAQRLAEQLKTASSGADMTQAMAAKEMVDIVHEYGKEAMMFMGDHWIGMEPFMDEFASIGLDAVVGSVGNGATLRLFSDIKNVKYTEGRFLPYFFPDTFHEGGDPVKEAKVNWVTARRAILRSPIQRIGYGGYLKLALEFPDFVQYIQEVCDEFRTLYDNIQGTTPYCVKRVAVLNCWGKMRSWGNHMVHHAIYYKQNYSYFGIIEALSGAPFDVSFISFDDIRENRELLKNFDVIINVGDADTAQTGGENWIDETISTAIREFVYNGGGFIGVGEPAAHQWQGKFFQLDDILGVEEERGFNLNTDKYNWDEHRDHFILQDTEGDVDFGEGKKNIFALPETEILIHKNQEVQMAVKTFGKGRGVYISGLPYSFENSRVLYRAVLWSASAEKELYCWYSSNYNVEVHAYVKNKKYCVVNNTYEPQDTTVYIGDGSSFELHMEPNEIKWYQIQ